MSLKHWFHRNKRPGTRGYRKDVCRQIAGKPLKCTVRREEDGTDTVIGRAGDLVFKDKILTVYADGQPIFACPYYWLEAGELLSHDGCMIQGPDMLHDNQKIMLLCYYLYWRKMD